MRRLLPLAIVLSGLLVGCASMLPFQCADTVGQEDCHHAYNVADEQLAAEERPDEVWVGRACPAADCPEGYLDAHILVVFRLPTGRMGIVVSLPEWSAARYQGELAFDPWR